MSSSGLVVTPIGVVEEEGEESAKVRVYENFAQGLKGLEVFSHVIVLYWLHGRDNPEDRAVLEVTPKRHPGAPAVGVFASRSPSRPNPVGFAVAEITAIDGPVLTLRGLDALRGSPVVDLKPYLPRAGAVPDVSARQAWTGARTRNATKRVRFGPFLPARKVIFSFTVLEILPLLASLGL